jgi:serine kinase of HPr protein (carbohydrate metabolism regulator)
MSEDMIHASCIAIGNRGVLLAGRSGAGKSDLALRLIDRGARLVSDDYTLLTLEAGLLLAGPPEAIRGKIEVRGVGLVEQESVERIPVCLIADLDLPPERLPELQVREIVGTSLPLVAIAPLEASAPIKLELALIRFGLPFP